MEVEHNLQDAMAVTGNILPNQKMVPHGDRGFYNTSTAYEVEDDHGNKLKALPVAWLPRHRKFRTFVENCCGKTIRVLIGLHAKH